LYESYYLHHSSCHHLWSEQVEVDGMDIPEVEGMNMVEEQDHPANHCLEEEGMNMVGSHNVEVEGMNTLKEYFHLMNHRPKVKGMDTMDTGMREDKTIELDDGAVRHRRTCRKWEELAKLGCSKDQSTFVSQDSSCSLS
jgi:hypothetical protein